MKGLLLKDLINLKRQAKIVIVLIAVYVLFSLFQQDNTMLGGIVAVLAGMMPITALAYDERAKWDKYALTMPISRGDLVVCKYVLGIILSIVAFVLNLVFWFLTKSVPFRETLIISAALLAVGIFFMSVLLPIMFKFGVEKGRIMMFILLFVPMGLIGFLPRLGIQMPDQKVLNALAYAAPLAIIAILAGSIAISMKIYQKKEF